MNRARSKPGVGDAFPEVVLPGLADGSPWSPTALWGTKTLLVAFASW